MTVRARHAPPWIAAALLVLCGAAPARAQSPRRLDATAVKLARRTAELRVEQDWLVMSVGWRDAVDEEIQKKLMSGLPTVVAARAYVFADKGDPPIALSAKTCRVVFDLWDEVFHIDLRQGGARRQTVAVNVEGVLRRCAEARALPLVATRALDPAHRYFVGVLVEVNPLSQEMLERIKRWVALPKGAGAVGPGDSLFGSFVGLFVTHVPDADKTLAFRTQDFAPADLPREEPRAP